MNEIIPIRENVDLIRYEGREILLVGTAHVSHQSAALVEEVILENRPESVCVELCAPRFESLKNPDRWKNTDIVEVIRSGKGYVLLSQLMLVGFQKKLGERLKIKPGEEMLRAVSVAEGLGAGIVLADREVRITLKRSWAGLSIFGMSHLLTAMIQGLFTKQEVTEAEIERLKSADALEEVLREFSEVLPQVRVALIDERDLYLASKIREAPGKKIVAIVGAGHVPGIKRSIFGPIDRAALEIIPKKGFWTRVINWAFPVIIAGIVLYAFSRSGVESGTQLISSWVITTGCFGALGAALTLSHPVSIVLAFLAAPITAFNPIVKAGRAAALSEAVLRKPRVSDFETIADDMSSLKGLFRNRVSRILLVLVVTTVTTWIGIIWGTKVMASLL